MEPPTSLRATVVANCPASPPRLHARCSPTWTFARRGRGRCSCIPRCCRMLTTSNKRSFIFLRRGCLHGLLDPQPFLAQCSSQSPDHERRASYPSPRYFFGVPECPICTSKLLRLYRPNCFGGNSSIQGMCLQLSNGNNSRFETWVQRRDPGRHT
jgi:hypothetical protein